MIRTKRLSSCLLQLLCLLGLLAISDQLLASGADERYSAAGKAYEKKDYGTAITAYEQLLQEGYRAADLYYNLGNAHFKAGHIAAAILNYERALKLAPDDEDTRYNLRIANLQVVDKIETMPAVFYRRWINSISGWCGPDTWSAWLIGLSWLLASIIFGFIITRSPGWKKVLFLSGVMVLFITLVVTLAGRESNRQVSRHDEAIILSPSVYVKSSPDEKGNDLFILHEGTKVSLQDQVGNWQEIRLANGTVGWVTLNVLEAI